MGNYFGVVDTETEEFGGGQEVREHISLLRTLDAARSQLRRVRMEMEQMVQFGYM